MIIVNTDREKFITGSYNNKNFNVPYEEELYSILKEYETQANSTESFAEYKAICESVEKVLTELNIKDKVEALDENVVKLTATGKYHITINGKVFNKVHIPEKIMDLIHSNIERGIEISPLVNLCIRFMLNPKPTQNRFNMLANYITATFTDLEEVERLTEAKFDIEVAKKLATYPDMQITAEGYIKTSKVVEEITKKWSLKLVDGKPVIEDGKLVKELVDAYAKTYSIDEETGEVTETTDYPEYMEDRKFSPAIYRNGDQFTSGGVLGYKYEIGKLAQLPSWDMVSMVDGEYHEKGLHTGKICPLAA